MMMMKKKKNDDDEEEEEQGEQIIIIVGMCWETLNVIIHYTYAHLGYWVTSLWVWLDTVPIMLASSGSTGQRGRRSSIRGFLNDRRRPQMNEAFV